MPHGLRVVRGTKSRVTTLFWKVVWWIFFSFRSITYPRLVIFFSDLFPGGGGKSRVTTLFGEFVLVKISCILKANLPWTCNEDQLNSCLLHASYYTKPGTNRLLGGVTIMLIMLFIYPSEQYWPTWKKQTYPRLALLNIPTFAICMPPQWNRYQSTIWETKNPLYNYRSKIEKV